VKGVALLRRFQLLGLLVLSINIVGCGETLGVGVSGIVTYKGQSIKEGLITFIPTAGTGGPGGGANIDDGHYHIPRRGGLLPGKYRVEIRSFEETGKEESKKVVQAQLFGRSISEVSSDAAVIEKVQKTRLEKKNTIPKRYNENSELTKDLHDQADVTVDFEL
jgi:hypothetical protein